MSSATKSTPSGHVSRSGFLKEFAWLVPPSLVVLLFLAVFASLCIGEYPMSFGHTAKLILHVLSPFHSASSPPWNLREIAVVKIIRPPRVIVATFTGLGLGIAGTALQGMLRNPLVGPDILGVSSGAAFGGVLGVSLALSPIGVLALAFAGGFLAISSVFAVARSARGANNSVMLILAGVFIGAFFLALVGLVQAYGNIFTTGKWVLGSFERADWYQVGMIVLPTLIGSVTLIVMRWRLNLLSLGDLDARSLGVNVGLLRWIIIAAVSLIVAAQVAATGIIAWVGLVMPHCARLLVGPDHRRLLPTAALLGSLYVLGLDDLTRVNTHISFPINALTAVVGTPLVCLLLWRAKGRGWTQ